MRKRIGTPGDWRWHRWILAAACCGFVGAAGPWSPDTDEPRVARSAGAAIPTPDGEVRFGRDVRPILSDRCFQCHGPDSRTREADLRLDLAPQPEAVWLGLLNPGKPEASELLRRVGSGDPNELMPPPHSNKPPLTPAEQAILRRWIEQGARYESHWSFIPPERPAVPTVRHDAWCRNPIDRFVVALLERQGVSPGPAADPATLVRRLYLDLTGLPPTPEEAAAFLADSDPAAYERLVDRLLTTEPYRTRAAEHATVRWLDGARYADTNGIHTDAGRQMWLWRDWVLQAYRDNMPYDQFIREQMAGDLLPNPTLAQKIASGFNRNHVITDEGGAINEEYLVEYAVDRTTTTGSVFLGLTLICARCHEHKFDPISQDEFYGLYAFFNSNEEPGLYSQQPNPNRAFEPFLAVPSAAQQAELDALAAQIAELRAQLDRPDPSEQTAFTEFLQAAQAMPHWQIAELRTAHSEGGAMLTIAADQSVEVGEKNPAQDVQTLTLRTAGRDLNLIGLEALPATTGNLIGRAENGNAVLSEFTAEAVSVTDPTQRVPLTFRWAWANVEQANGDFGILNVLDGRPQTGWAVAGHQVPGSRLAYFLSDTPFGFAGGTDLIVRLKYESIYPQHTLARVRLNVGSIAEDALAKFPLASSGWFRLGPWESRDGQDPYQTMFGPEQGSEFSRDQTWGPQPEPWRYDEKLRDATVNNLDGGTNVHFLGRQLWAPCRERLKLSLGSDDGFELFLNGVSVAKREVQRGVQPDQDEVEIELRPGANWLVLKVINTGGAAGFYFRSLATAEGWPLETLAALAPSGFLNDEARTSLQQRWRLHFSPGYRETQQRIAELEAKQNELRQSTPLTMVMQERTEPRQTYVLIRGVYDKPDMQRPVQRSIPAALGSWPAELPRNRLGLAEWLVSPQNPLVARVAVNRIWEQFFGTGIVETSEDFGSQGQWPSHPELLDWLAVEFRENGWDSQHLMRLIVTSQTYRQASTIRPEVREKDPQNRWLAAFPRRRLNAEQIRDQALFVSGLLVEQLGGPSVKPYQPDGIWSEVAMPASNTRNYQQGTGADLWRRSLYTYWKRACPPPALMTFDAPTRESCTIRRGTTNTPLQALVLWNDPQFVEAARVLATRTLSAAADDEARIEQLFRRLMVRGPEPRERAALVAGLAEFRQMYAADPAAAAALLQVGETAVPENVPAAELAAWTMLASSLMNLSEALTIN